jgi:hypothetical protein
MADARAWPVKTSGRPERRDPDSPTTLLAAHPAGDVRQVPRKACAKPRPPKRRTPAASSSSVGGSASETSSPPAAVGSDAHLEWRLTQRAARPFKVTASLSLVFFATKPRPLSRSIRSGFGSPHPRPLANSARVPKSPRRSSFLAHRLRSMTHRTKLTHQVSIEPKL